MGVRGLTSYIARHAELYLKPYELHDCSLVIDGDNLACNLYKDVAGKNSAFGGDYDAFYRTVVEFFHVLSECNIRAYVLMDGGYEKKKLRTVWQRLRGKIAVVKRIDPLKSSHIFPLMMREVFVDAVNDCGIPVMRCVFEADDELAALSRKLNCPVLSYDSDFYIHNVKYIPLVTLTLKAHKKKVSQKEIRKENKKLSKSDAKHLEKRSKANKIIKEVQVDFEEKNAPKTGKTYKYLDCCLYKIEHLVKKGSLTREKLPLFAALLGNDYIPRAAFKCFFSQMGQKGLGKRTNRLHKRIQKILLWLKNETLDSALKKILLTMKKPQRKRLLAQMTSAVQGYSTESCMAYDFFKTHYTNAIDSDIESENDESIEEPSEDLDEIVTEEGETENETEEEDNSSNEDELLEKDEDKIDLISDVESISSSSEDGEEDNDETDPNAFLPQWFRDRLYPANLPRFFVDLAHLRIYINNPQIEHFPFNDCNEIGLPILQYIFSLLYNIDGNEGDTIFKGNSAKKEEAAGEIADGQIGPYFRYLTRLTRVTNIHTVRYYLGPPPIIAFNPHDPDVELFRVVFSKLKLDCGELFTGIEKIPKDLQLYFLSIVYWIQKTPHADLLHLHAILICLVVLRTVDSKLEPIRDCRAFQKRFGTIIKRESQIRLKDQEDGKVKQYSPEIQKLSPVQRMKFISKVDCILVQDNLLKHFHMQELFKKKYDAFSSTILHGFAEFQSVVFNLHGLNGLLNNIYESPKMAQAFCGVFIYNIYDLLRSRIDLNYFIQQHIFRMSPMMFDLYEFFWKWCEKFIPEWQKNKTGGNALAASKNVLKKRRAAARKKANAAAAGAAAEVVVENVDANAEMVESESTEDDFYSLNNKFGTLLKI